MFPAATLSSVAVKPVQPAPTQTAQKTTQPQAPETARASAGEAAAANIKAETSQAVQAAEQSSVAPRLRDQENAERTERRDVPTGPPPSFEETPLERQARVAFDPPEVPAEPQQIAEPKAKSDAADVGEGEAAPVTTESPADPPPTKSEKAEASFSETRGLAEPREPAVDVTA